MAASDDIRRAHTILIDDETLHVNARKRRIGFYEYNGWLKRIYGDQTRWGVDAVDWPGTMSDKVPDSFKMFFNDSYSAAQYVSGAPDVRVRIRARHGRLQTLRTGDGGFVLDVVKLRNP
jgi:hypothetical protein